MVVSVPGSYESMNSVQYSGVTLDFIFFPSEVATLQIHLPTLHLDISHHFSHRTITLLYFILLIKIPFIYVVIQSHVFYYLERIKYN